MSNLSYCRFQNTVSDFEDFLENLRDLDTSDKSWNNLEEIRSRAKLIRPAVMMMDEIGVEIETRQVDDAIDELNEDIME